MKRLCLVLITIGLAVAGLPCVAETACRGLVVRGLVEVGEGELTLADLLGPGTCPEWYRAAAQVSLGMVPKAGSGRVIEGGEIRRLLDTLTEREAAGSKAMLREAASREVQVPERVVVRQARAFKSCAEIADFVSAAMRAEGEWSGGEGKNQNKDQTLDCAAARTIPEDASLELLKTIWNAGLERREFGLRCLHSEDCIPFLVWEREPAAAARAGGFLRGRKTEGGNAGNEASRLIKRGQTVMLTWEQAGIRVVLPVTCLEAGGLGEFVRVRFKYAPGTLRAEVVGAGAVRASL
jgi:hypothetical protein